MFKTSSRTHPVTYGYAFTASIRNKCISSSKRENINYIMLHLLNMCQLEQQNRISTDHLSASFVLLLDALHALAGLPTYSNSVRKNLFGFQI